MALTEALCLMQTWWAAPISQAVADGAGSGVAQSRFSQLNFASHGITPLGYAAFAFALGVAAGALIRRTVPAMAVTLAIFAALQVAMPLWVRPNLAPPDRTVIPVTSLGAAIPSETGAGGTIFTFYAITIPGQPGAWLLSSGPVNAAGQPVSATPAACISVEGTSPSPGTNQAASPQGATTGPVTFRGCLASHGIREAITYQPASRYWRFQADRDRDLPRPGPGPGRVLLPAAPPPFLKGPDNAKWPRSLRHASQSGARLAFWSWAASRPGGAPNSRRYSRLNCEALV